MAGPVKTKSMAMPEGEIPSARDAPFESPLAEEVVETLAAPPDEVVASTAPDLKTVFLGGLFFFAGAAVCYAASDFVLPIVVGLVLMLVLQPAMRGLEGLRVPRVLAALVLIVVLFGVLAGIVTVLSGPVSTWVQHLPEGIPKLQERLSFLSQPIAAFQRLMVRVQALAHVAGPSPMPVTVDGTALSDRLLSGTRYFVSEIGTTVLVLFFLLVGGDSFLRRLVEILPRFRSKRQAVEIWQQIERDISAYLLTITIMNLGVGLATALVVWLCGPMVAVIVFLLAGLLEIDSLWLAFLPAGLYLGIHLLEGETITPLLLARRFTINPVLIVIALIFWYWMWGVPGAILATPMLAITKIVCDRIPSLAAFGHFIEA
jgi:predicted PurR-regulated permease PerM